MTVLTCPGESANAASAKGFTIMSWLKRPRSPLRCAPPGQADRAAAHAEDVHVVVLDALERREVIVDERRADAMSHDIANEDARLGIR